MKYIPLYVQLKDIIQKRIVNKEYDEYKALPSEATLAKEFKTSVSTVRQALALLVAEGIVEKRQGKGNFIATNKKTLSLFTWMTETKYGEEILNNTIIKFEKLEPAIQIKIIPTTYDEAQDQLISLITLGKAPDIVHIMSHWTSYFASKGALAPLERFLTKNQLENRYYQKDLIGGRFHNKQYSIAWGLSPIALIANKNILEAAGLGNIPRQFTLTDFIEYCQQIDRHYSGKNVYSYGFSNSNSEIDFLQIYPFFLAFGGKLFDSENKVAFNSLENIEAFKWLREFANKCHIKKGSIKELRSDLAENRLAFISDGPWIRYIIRELTGRSLESKFTVYKNPINNQKNSASWCYNHALAICSQSDNKILAGRFIDCLTSDPEVSNYYYANIGTLPVAMSKTTIEPTANENTKVFSELLEYSTCINSTNEYFEKSMEFCLDSFNKILFSDSDIEHELNEKQYYLQLLLD